MLPAAVPLGPGKPSGLAPRGQSYPDLLRGGAGELRTHPPQHPRGQFSCWDHGALHPKKSQGPHPAPTAFQRTREQCRALALGKTRIPKTTLTALEVFSFPDPAPPHSFAHGNSEAPEEGRGLPMPPRVQGFAAFPSFRSFQQSLEPREAAAQPLTLLWSRD